MRGRKGRSRLTSAQSTSKSSARDTRVNELARPRLELHFDQERRERAARITSLA